MKGYSTFVIKSYDEDERIIKGIASTPTLDQHGDIVEPTGASYDLPMPFRFEHKEIAGDVISLEINDKGEMEIEAKIAKTSDSPSIVKRLKQFWDSIKSGDVRGLSVGITADKNKVKKLPGGGMHFVEWMLTEISAVAMPANLESTIVNIKSLDTGTSFGSEKSALRSVSLSDKNKHREGALYLKEIH